MIAPLRFGGPLRICGGGEAEALEARHLPGLGASCSWKSPQWFPSGWLQGLRLFCFRLADAGDVRDEGEVVRRPGRHSAAVTGCRRLLLSFMLGRRIQRRRGRDGPADQGCSREKPRGCAGAATCKDLDHKARLEPPSWACLALASSGERRCCHICHILLSLPKDPC